MDTYGEWKVVDGLPNLQVSSCGYVRQCGRGGFWSPPYKPSPNPRGYHVVVHHGVHYRVHVLVATAFIGERPPGHTVDHIDRKRSNNSVGNLRWATGEQQVANRNRNRKRVDIQEEVADELGEEFRTTSTGFDVSQYGRVLHRASGRLYRPTPNAGCEYARVCDVLLHRLVADAFPDIVGVRTSSTDTVDHIDRDKSNNHAKNLRWATASEQRTNQEQPAWRGTAHQHVDWVAVDVCPPDGSTWTSYDNMTLAAAAIQSVVGAPVSHSQVSLAVRSNPAGHVAKQGCFKGWKLRLAGTGDLQPADIVSKRRKASSDAVPVAYRAPGEDSWTSCSSSLQASKSIMENYNTTINSGSISRFVAKNPLGHRVTSKANIGWEFKMST